MNTPIFVAHRNRSASNEIEQFDRFTVFFLSPSLNTFRWDAHGEWDHSTTTSIHIQLRSNEQKTIIIILCSTTMGNLIFCTGGYWVMTYTHRTDHSLRCSDAFTYSFKDCVREIRVKWWTRKMMVERNGNRSFQGERRQKWNNHT